MRRFNLVSIILIAFLCIYSVNAQNTYEEWVAGQLIDEELPEPPSPPFVSGEICQSVTGSYYGNPNTNYDFIPNESDKSITLRVNLVFIQNLAGEGNFTGNEPEFDEIFGAVATRVNEHYANLVNPNDPNCYDGPDFVPDTKVRFEFHHEFVKVPDYYFDFPNGIFTANRDEKFQYVFDILYADPTYKPGICVFITTNKTNWEEMVVNQTTTVYQSNGLSDGEYPYLDLTLDNKIHMPNGFVKYWWMKNILPGNVYPHPWDPTLKSWYISGFTHTLVHELGHNLSLRHWNEHHSTNECHYSIMHQGAANPHNYLPPSEIGKIHKAIRMTNLRRYVSDVSFDKKPLIVDQDVEWAFNHKRYRNITVANGGRLTLSCETYMDHRNRILVEKGGRLIIDGGHLTTDDGEFWQGVFVEGNSSASQLPPENQGVLEIKNGGTISNARIGARCYLEDTPATKSGETMPSFHSTGGIIQANGAKFINNEVAISFKEYTQLNQSYFTFCIFETNKDVYDNVSASYFMKLSNVKGIEVKGCTFEDSRDVSQPDYLFSGIYGFGAGVFVGTKCLNFIADECVESEPTSFINLNYGVKLHGNGNNYRVKVNESVFKDVNRATYYSAINYADFLSNDIQNSTYGLYLEGCTGYHVENNKFYSASQPNFGVGVYVSNSGNDHNEIYNNFFTNLNYGVVSNGDNRNASDGLCIKCNNYTQTKYDIAINQGVAGDGIAYYQGNPGTKPTDPAGNIFTSPFSGHWDIINNAEDILYFYHRWNGGENIKPLTFTPLTVSLSYLNSTFDKPTSCPSKVSTGTIETNKMLADLDNATSNSNSINEQLNTSIDGGNTDALAMQVNTTTPLNVLETQDELMTNSPYLSEEVLQVTAEKENALLDVMIRDVMVENPQAAKSSKVKTALDERMDPLPDYMMAQIMAGEEVIGTKETLEAQMVDWNSISAEKFQLLTQHYLGEEDYQSLYDLFANYPTLSNQYNLSLLYTHNNLQTSAANTSESIPSTFELDEVELANHNDFYELQNCLKEMVADEVNGLVPDDITNETLVQLSEKENLAGILARNILIENQLMDYTEEMLLPVPENLKHSAVQDDFSTEQVSVFSVSPNPATDYIAVEFIAGQESGIIEIRNVSGKLVRQIELGNGTNSEVIRLEGIVSGTYLCSFVVKGKIIDAKKLIIQ